MIQFKIWVSEQSTKSYLPLKISYARKFQEEVIEYKKMILANTLKYNYGKSP